MTRIGDLRHHIEIGRYAAGQDQYGDPLLKTWQRVAAIWASVEGLTGNQYFQAQQTVDQSDHKVIIRYRQGIEQGMIVRHAGREFRIKAVLDKDGRRRFLELLCKEVKPA